MASIFDILSGMSQEQNQTPIDWRKQGMLSEETPADGSTFIPDNSVATPGFNPAANRNPNPGMLNQAQGQGILNNNQSQGGFFDGFGNKLANALLAGGSRNPAETITKLQASDAEINRPKVTPLADGAFSQIAFPNGTTKIVRNDQVADFLKSQGESKFQQGLEKIILGGRVQSQLADVKGDIKTAQDATTGLQETTSLKNRYKAAMDIVAPVKLNPDGSPMVGQDGLPVREARPLSERAAALPGVKPLAEFFGAKGAADNLALQEITVDETLLKTANTKGAISNQEMDLFKSPMPKPWADPELWMAQATKRLQVLDKIEAFQQSQIAKGQDPAAGITGKPMGSSQAAPNAAKYQPVDEAAVRSAGLVFDPAYEHFYVDGKIRRKKK